MFCWRSHHKYLIFSHRLSFHFCKIDAIFSQMHQQSISALKLLFGLPHCWKETSRAFTLIYWTPEKREGRQMNGSWWAFNRGRRLVYAKVSRSVFNYRCSLLCLYWNIFLFILFPRHAFNLLVMEYCITEIIIFSSWICCLYYSLLYSIRVCCMYPDCTAWHYVLNGMKYNVPMCSLD